MQKHFKKNWTMARVSTYLNFGRNTEEAFNFYKSVFSTEFNGPIARFKDVPPQEGTPPMPESVMNLVMHIELPITGGHVLMGTDAPEEMGFKINFGNNVHINLEPDSREEAKKLFDGLAVGGTVSMPLADMFWGAYFGSLTDKYGVNWMVNTSAK
jgi:PhnB protein